jgi:hypothetical protein
MPSLSVREGRNGCTLIRCFAGCTKEAILSAVGLRFSDLFADTKPDRKALALAEKMRAQEAREAKARRREAWRKWMVARKWEAVRDALGLLLIQRPQDSKLASLFHWACGRSRELDDAETEIALAYGFKIAPLRSGGYICPRVWLEWDTPPRGIDGITAYDVGRQVGRYLRLPNE